MKQLMNSRIIIYTSVLAVMLISSFLMIMQQYYQAAFLICAFIACAYCFLIYITVRQEITESQAKESERQYWELVNSINSIIIHWNQEGKIIFINEFGEQFFGYSKEEIVDRPIFGTILTQQESTGRNLYAMLEEIVRNPEDYMTNINENIKKNGERVWIQWNNRVLKEDKTGIVTGFSVGVDITVHKKLEREIKESEERFKLIFDNVQAGIVIIDAETHEVFDVNQRVLTMVGAKKEELVGKSCHNFICPTDLGKCPISDLGQTIDNSERVLLTNDGRQIPVIKTVIPIMLRGRKYLLESFVDILDRISVEEALNESRQRLELAIKGGNLGFWDVDIKAKKMIVNERWAEIFECSTDEIDDAYSLWINSIYSEDREQVIQVIKEKISEIKLEYRIITKLGHIKWLLVQGAVVEYDNDGSASRMTGTIIDITGRKMAEKSQKALYQISEMTVLSQSLEDLYRYVHDIIDELIPAKNFYIAIYDEKEERIHFPYRVDECDGNPGSRQLKKGLTEYVIRTGKPIFVNPKRHAELEAQGEVVTSGTPAVDWLGVPLKVNDNKVFGVMAVQTYTEGVRYTEKDRDILTFVSNQVAMAIQRKHSENKMRFISMHDALTGLYNRAFFEEKLQRLQSVGCVPLSLIICDIDGLKLVNDTLGHAAGDELLIAAARIIKGSLREGDIAARIGGDEFAIILPEVDERIAESFCDRIKVQLLKYNQQRSRVPVSLSAGYAVKQDKATSLEDLFKEADDCMYREKLHHSQSIRSDIVETVMNMLEVRDFITEGHAERLQDLTAGLARKLGLPDKRITDIRLFAKFHDIGKVGISDSILFKPGPLTPEERKKMQRHCEIGYRIALSADLLPIAEWILKHHEWWNGKGYPLGLSEETIPLECRILAIADAYDAMVSDRPYRKGMSSDDAIGELKRCAGVQFDPQLVEKFVDVIKPLNKVEETA